MQPSRFSYDVFWRVVYETDVPFAACSSLSSSTFWARLTTATSTYRHALFPPISERLVSAILEHVFTVDGLYFSAALEILFVPRSELAIAVTTHLPKLSSRKFGLQL